jgi:hypothetical protein
MRAVPGAAIVATPGGDERVSDDGRATGASEAAGSHRSGGVGNWFAFEAAIPVAALRGGSSNPGEFAFDLQGHGLREEEVEVHFSAADLFSIFRPYAWGTVERRTDPQESTKERRSDAER